MSISSRAGNRGKKVNQRVRGDRRLAQWLLVVVVAGVVSGVVVQQVTAAWQNPTCDPNTNPDSCNAAAPINVSAAAQTKNGPLTVTVNTGTNALTVNTGSTGSPVALAINSAGAGYGINVANSATSGALVINSTGASTAATINQNQTGGTGLKVQVAGSTGGTALSGTSTTSTTGLGVVGLGSGAGVYGSGQTNGVGVSGRGTGTGSGILGQVATGSTAPAGYFDGTNSNKALTTVNGQVLMSSAIANTPTVSVASTATGATGPSAITGQNEGSGSPAIYGTGKNSYGVSGNTQSYNYAGVLGCYGSTTNCAMLGTGTYAGYFNGKVLVEQSLRVNSVAAAKTLQEGMVQGQYSDNNFTEFSLASFLTGPTAVESDGNYIWECNSGAVIPMIVKIRPTDGHYVGVFYLPLGFDCSDLVFDGRYMWATSSGAMIGLERIDVANHVMTYFNTGITVRGLSFDGAYLWATAYNNNQLLKINPSTGAITASYPTLGGGGPYGITSANGSLWFTNYNPVGGKYYLSKINPDGSGLTNYPITALAPTRLVFDGDGLWVPSTILNSSGQAPLSKIDVLNGTETLVVNLAEVASDITFDQNLLWVSGASAAHQMYLLRPIDGSQFTILTPSSSSGAGLIRRLFFDGHAVWYTLGTDNVIGRFTVPWSDGYTDGNLFGGVALYDAASNTYTCIQSDGAGGITTVAGLCP